MRQTIESQVRDLRTFLQNADKEFECQFCGVVYATSFGRATCGADQCIDTYCHKHKLRRGDDHVTKRENEALKWRAANIPVDFQHAEAADIHSEHHWRTRKSVRIIGAPGRGKTHAAVALLKDAIRKGASGRFVSAAQYLKAVKATYRKGARQSEADVLADFVEPDCLVIDDLGASGNTEHGWGEMLTLMEERAWAHKTTIITTNLSPVEIYEREPRMASRIQGWRVIECGGEDRRAAQ